MAKRLCVDDEEEEDGQQVSADPRETVNNPPLIMPNVDVNRNEAKSGSESFSGPIPEPTRPPSKDFAQEGDRLRKEVKHKMETLRRLKMAQMYRSKVSAAFKLSGLLLTWTQGDLICLNGHFIWHIPCFSSQNDLTQLQTLIDKWRSCAQAALYELQSEVPIDGGKASLSGLIDLFGLDDGILHFDRTEEDFTP